MKKLRITLLMLSAICALPLMAQSQTVSGLVKDVDGGIPRVSVREIDASHRVFNNTRTDANGLFSFRVRDAQHSLQFYAPGYRVFTHKMLGQSRFTVTLEKRRLSPYADAAKVLFQSDRLLCGHYLSEEVPMQAWMEKMCDTLYAIILPIEMKSMVDEYPAGRQAIVLDASGREVARAENVVDCYPVKGNPDEMDQMRLAQTYTGTGRFPGGSDDEVTLYAYPHFQFSRAQLELFCQQPALLDRLVVDTYRADNYWNFFPTSETLKLFQKALSK